MSSLRLAVIALCGILCLAAPAAAQLTALARVDAAHSGIADHEDGVGLTLALSQPVPWRVFTLDEPRRLVLDLAKVSWPAAIPVTTDKAAPPQTGVFQAGWSRMVVPLKGAFAIDHAVLETGAPDGSATLRVSLQQVSDETFAALSGIPDNIRALPEPSRKTVPQSAAGTGMLRVMLDPGHGGVDPGAEAGGLQEAGLMLTFARELRETLIRAGGFQVALTREDDLFVPLETRITLAREFQADVLLSLHADALPDSAGHASGATVYTLSTEASDWASQRIAERHNRSDLLTGVDIEGPGDEIALVLMDLARRETAPRAERLAGHIVREITSGTGHVNGRPHRHAGLSVLKAPDIPSILVELGFLSSEEDRERLSDPAWRAQAADAIRIALRDWARDEALRAAAGTSQ